MVFLTYRHRIPEEVRARDYKGHEKLSIELSEEDKIYIVEVYSKGIVENPK